MNYQLMLRGFLRFLQFLQPSESPSPTGASVSTGSERSEMGWGTLRVTDLTDIRAIDGGKKYRPHCRPEQQIQRTVLEHLKLRHAPDIFWFHVGNGGYRTPIEAKVLKLLGVMAGVPDLILIRGGKTYGLELKAHGGRLRPVQRTAHMLMRAAGAEAEVAIGLDAALRQLESWGLLRGCVT